MRPFKKFCSIEEDAYILVEAALLAEEELDEKFDIKSVMKKAGLSAERHLGGKGLIQILKNTSVHVARAFVLGLKAHVFKKKDAKEELKQHLKRKVTRQEIIDFLLRLDQISLHIFTGPIHIIDALTGWELAADLQSSGKDVSGRVKTAIDSLDNVKLDVGGSRVKRIDKIVLTLKKMFGIK